jgi:hypothetical protein
MSHERQRARQLKAVTAGMTIQRQIGLMDTRDSVEHVRIAALAAIAETRGMWRFLVERGLATEAQRQDYLDKGYDDLLEQVNGKAAEIYVEGASGRG